MSFLLDLAERWLAPGSLFPPRRDEDISHYFARVRPKIAANPKLLSQPFELREDDKREPQHFSELPLHWLYARAAEELMAAESAQEAFVKERAANGDMPPDDVFGEGAGFAPQGDLPAKSEESANPREKLRFYESHFLDWVSLADNVDEVVSNRWGDPRWEERSFHARDTRRLLALAVGDDTFMAPAPWVKALLEAGADANGDAVGVSAALFRVLWRYNDANREGRWSDGAQVAQLLLNYGADPWKEAQLDSQSASNAGRLWMIATQLKGEGKSLSAMSLINKEPNITPGVRNAILAWVRRDLEAATDFADSETGLDAALHEQEAKSQKGEKNGVERAARKAPRRL